MCVKRGIGLSATLLSLMASGAYAQQTAGSAPAFSNAPSQSAQRGYAGSSFGSPIAFGPKAGSAGIGVFALAFEDQATGSHGEDSSAGISIGLGNPDKYIGLETSAAIASLTHHNGDHFASGGSFGFKLHTNLLHVAAVALGVTSAHPWGTAKKGNSESYYLAASKVVPVRLAGSSHAVVLNIGVGNNQFTSDTKGLNSFGSLAFYFDRQFSVIVDSSGRFTNAGFSWAPFRRIPLSFTLGAFNVGGRQGLKTGIAGGAGMGFDLSRI